MTLVQKVDDSARPPVELRPSRHLESKMMFVVVQAMIVIGE